MSDIDTAAADSLKVLDPKRPIREADIFTDAKLMAVLTRRRTPIRLLSVYAAPTARAVALAPGKYACEMALVYKPAKLGNIGEFAAWVL